MEDQRNSLPDSEVFLLSFIGEMVQVLTDFTLTTSNFVENASDGSLSNEDSAHPLIVEGYLLDSDNNYIYLGSSPDQVSQAIKKERIVFIQTLDKKDELSELMGSLSNKSRRDMN